MEFRLNEEEESFRRELSDWLDRNLPAGSCTPEPGPGGSILKLFWSELDQRVKETALEAEGPYAALSAGSERAVDAGRWQHELLWSRAGTIYAGTSEVQRNVLGQRVLGLPRG